MADIDLEIMERLITMMVDNNLSELQYRHGEVEIELKRGSQQDPQIIMQPAPQLAAPTAAPVLAAPSETPPAEAVDDTAGLVPINSPMVGTYYASPDPESAPFVSKGAHVSADTTVCIIEAMKVFNEIKAEVSGTIVKIEASNSQPVEYGQPLFYVQPD